MFQKSQLINRRPNVRQYTDKLRDVQDDDDDDQGISSFARSKVDDDDEKFKNQNSDPDFLDNLLRKKSRQDSKSNNSSMLPSTPPPPSAGKKTDPDVSNTDPKKGQPSTQNNSATNKEPQKTPARQNSTQAFQTPDPKQQQPQPKTPQPPPQQQTPVTNKTPAAKETPKNPPVQPPTNPKQATPANPVNPKVTTPVNPKINEPKTTTPKPATPAPPQKIVEPPVTINKTPAKREDPPVQQPAQQLPIQSPVQQQPQETKLPDVSNDRPNFVRRGKNVAAVKDVVSTIKLLQEDRITAYEPKNNIEVSKKLSLRFAPQQPYVDPTFPPNDLQVFQVFGNGKVDFKRINLNRDLDTHQVVDPNDITPGSQASSLMQVLAAMAEQPSIVSRILEDQIVNENGFYYARLCICGVWKYILIDDHLGYLNGKPIGATSTVDPNKLKSLSKQNPGYHSELWPFIIEKAFAKEYGSYQDAANKSTVVDFLAEVTGAPIIIGNEQILNQLTSTSVALVHLKDGVYTYLSKDGNSVTLRNPWGWNGKPPQNAQSEGEFKVPLKDIQQVTIAKYNPQYYSVSYNAKAEHDSYTAFNVLYNESTAAAFGFHQRDQRYFRNNIAQKYDYSFARILVFNEQQELIGQISGQQKSLSLEIEVEKGRYTIVTIIDFQTEQVYDSTFTYYGPNPIKISRINYRESPNLLATLLTKETLSQGQRKTSGQVEEYVYQAPFKLIVIAWKFSGSGNIKWNKDLTKQANRQNMKPLTFANPQDVQSIMKLTTEQLKQLKQSSWQNAPSFNIEFTSTNTTHAVVFK